MITDPQKIRRGDPGRPEICNVFCYEKLFGTPAERVAEIDRTCRTGELGCREHKDEIAERIVEYLRPFRERRAAGARRPRRARADARPRRRARPRDRRAEHGAREGGDGAVRQQPSSKPLDASGSDLDVFEGPFDLLVTLILNEDVDLLEVHLAEIVLAYIERLEARGELDLEAATEFLILIAALLELKSRLMLPVRGEEGLDLEPAGGGRGAARAAARVPPLPRGVGVDARAARRRAGLPLPRRAAAAGAAPGGARGGRQGLRARSGSADAMRGAAAHAAAGRHQPHDAGHGVARAPARAPARPAALARGASRSTTRSASRTA